MKRTLALVLALAALLLAAPSAGAPAEAPSSPDAAAIGPEQAAIVPGDAPEQAAPEEDAPEQAAPEEDAPEQAVSGDASGPENTPGAVDTPGDLLSDAEGIADPQDTPGAVDASGAGLGARAAGSLAEEVLDAAEALEDARAAGEVVPEDALWLAAGALEPVDLDAGEVLYAFTAPSGSVYDVWLFPADAGEVRVHAELWQGGTLAAAGDGGMPALSLRLKSGATYLLKLSGAGKARLEVARHALSRCYDQPMLLDAAGDVYAKAIARSGDVHWYAVDVDSALPMLLVGAPEADGLRLEAWLFDDGGRLLARAGQTEGGACLLGTIPEAGRRCFLRLSAGDDAVGLYTLRLARGQGAALPEGLSLSRQALALEGRAAFRLTATAAPEGAAGPLYWESSDREVARVDDTGLVTGRREGTAVITAYGAAGVSASCEVTVRYVPVRSARLLSDRISLNVGDDAAIECEVLPANASDPRLTFSASPEGIVEVDRRGVLRAVAEGTAMVTVRTVDGGAEAALTVTVGPAQKRFRALLVGEQNYASTVAAPRLGSANSVSGLRSMLENLSCGGARFQVSTQLDASRDQVLAAIDRTFEGATAQDLSLFYITCHGAYTGGMTCFQLYDGSTLTAAELAQALRRVPGEVFVVIDCCGSGGAIGRASDTSDILRGIDAVFGGTAGPAALSSSKFRVLASAALEQESYRISFRREAGETDMATVFARALCEGGGWSIERGARSAMRADVDYDGVVTLNELYVYTARRVRWYLGLTGADYAQSVQVWPEGDGEGIFERTG